MAISAGVMLKWLHPRHWRGRSRAARKDQPQLLRLQPQRGLRLVCELGGEHEQKRD